MRRRTALFLATVPFLLVLGWAAAGTALAGGGCHGEEEATTTEGSSSVVRLQGCTFGPTITRVPVGTEVTVIRGTVFNRHGMPPSPAALLCATPPAGAA